MPVTLNPIRNRLNILKNIKVSGLDGSFNGYYKKIPKKSCEICGETRYLEKCHIIPRSLDYFTARIPNPKENILILCPNCHKYFDTGALKPEELDKIKDKVLSTITNFYKGVEGIYKQGVKQFNLGSNNIETGLNYIDETILKKTRNKWLKNLIKEKQLSSIGAQEARA